MPTGIESLDQLQSRILDLDARKYDLLADTRRMEMAVSGHLHVDTQESVAMISPGATMHSQIALDLGIPKRYYDRMGAELPSLRAESVNRWMQHGPETRMLRTYTTDGTDTLAGRAWLSDRFKRLDHIEIARHLLPEFESLGQPVEFHNAAITDDRLYLRATFPNMERAVKVGDAVRWGVEIRNSEVGKGTLSISGFVLRLVCTNGMVATRALSRRHLGSRLEEASFYADETIQADDRALWLQARDTLRETISATTFESVVEQLKNAAESEQFRSIPRATDVLTQRYALADSEREMVQIHLAAGNDLSRWGAINAITRTAQGVGSFDRQVELEEAGWALASTPADWSAVLAAS